MDGRPRLAPTSTSTSPRTPGAQRDERHGFQTTFPARSPQQVLDCGLQLLGILGPVAIDFQAIGSNGPAVCSTPLMQRLVGCSKLRIRPAVDDDRGFANRRRHAGHIALANEGPDHLDAKIDRHDGRTFVMIEKGVVAIGPQTGVFAEKSPYAVERRFEGCGNILNCNAPAHGRKNPGGERLNFHFIRHDISLTPGRLNRFSRDQRSPSEKVCWFVDPAWPRATSLYEGRQSPSRVTTCYTRKEC